MATYWYCYLIVEIIISFYAQDKGNVYVHNSGTVLIKFILLVYQYNNKKKKKKKKKYNNYNNKCNNNNNNNIYK